MKVAGLKIFIFLFAFVPLLLPTAFAHAAPIKILLVPGHDNTTWGAQFGKLKEADMTLAVATNIFNILKLDPRFDVHITRDANGYTPEFAAYFSNGAANIASFRDTAKATHEAHVATGHYIEKAGINHNAVNDDTSLVLYGINKWVNENNVDMVLHIHFNNYPRKHMKKAGKYKGFTIYIPDPQMGNSKESTVLAQSIFSELKTIYPTSTYPSEQGGMINDQELISLGANGTLASVTRSLLIEYGYIYTFANSTVRQKAYIDMANLTAAGIQNYFFPPITNSVLPPT